MMAFLAPLFLAGMFAAAIPVVIHLFHRRTDPVVEFAAMRYLRRAPVEQSHRRRLRELLLLTLRVAALLLLAFAFARPYFADAAAASGAAATVVLIDTSASISAPDRFERARARAHAAIRDAPSTHAVAVARFAAAVDVIAPLSSDRAAAHAAVEAVQPGAGGTRYRVALTRGAELLEGRPGRLVVISDLQESGWDAGDSGAIPERIDVVVDDVGSPPANIAITSLRVDDAEAVAVVHNFSTEQVKEQVTFALDGRPAGVALVAVPAGGVAEARVPVPSRDQSMSPRALEARVTDRFGYPADNTRYAVLDPTASPAILLVTASGLPSEAFFLERALTVADGPHGFRVAIRGGPAVSSMTDEAVSAFDVIAILATRGIARLARERLAGYVQSGGGLLLAAGPDVDPSSDTLAAFVDTRWTTRKEAPLVFAPEDSRHPVFRPFGGAATLANVTFTRAVAIDTARSADIIARYSDGTPALVEEQRGKGRVLLFASDLNDRWNDFALQPVFVPFVHEVMRYLAAARSHRSEYLVGDLGAGAALSPGVVVHAGRPIAINVDPRESDPARLTVDAFAAGVSRLNATSARQAVSDAREREDTQRLWQVALAVMLAGLLIEGAMGRRLA